MNTTHPLADDVVAALSKCGHKNPSKWQRGLDITGISKLPEAIQTKLITTHIKQVVGKHDSGNVRQNLDPSEKRDNWIKSFETYVAPLMCQNDI